MGEQHDHHCLLSFMGHDWRITAKRRNLVALMRRAQNELLSPFRSDFPPAGGYPTLEVHELLDITHVDWNLYCETALAWDQKRSNNALHDH